MEKALQSNSVARNSGQFREYLIASRAIQRIFNCFLVRNYSAIPCSEMAQAEAIIARNKIPIGNPTYPRFFSLSRNPQYFLSLFLSLLETTSIARRCPWNEKNLNSNFLSLRVNMGSLKKQTIWFSRLAHYS